MWSQGGRGRCRARGGVCALLLSRVRGGGRGGGEERESERERKRDMLSRPMSAEIAWGRGQVTARRAAVGRGRARLVAPPTPVSGCREGGAPAAAAAALQVKGGQVPGVRAGRGHSGRCPSGKPRSQNFGSPAWPGRRGKPSQGAPLQGHQASAGTVPGFAGPSPPSSLGSGAPCPARSRICRVTTRKSGLGAQPLTFFLAQRAERVLRARPLPRWDSGCSAPVPGPALRGVQFVTFRRPVVHLLASPGEERGSSVGNSS
ncbi:unnamed protein product [Rangifer tarandus platyrhynchus]|uniref:Uncharacterized protein n=2 Tax=Rangifer tarandus platyrhynchus TaxID=3082113 RepID=A0ACB0DWI1_RANTA|nr:unnamed protein product [Rangifer tarandus platyrhynchus]CAI9692596.1 unnamed protein product [Rangifer tarandus platyrhynchus]